MKGDQHDCPPWLVELVKRKIQETKEVKHTFDEDCKLGLHNMCQEHPNKNIEWESVLDTFIKEWCGENAPHLLDNDENAGERLRETIRQTLQAQRSKYEEEIKLLKEKAWKYDDLCK